MKKIFKLIPLLILPIALSSCTLLNKIINENGQEQGQTTKTTFELSSESLSLGFGSTAKLSASKQEDGKAVGVVINWSTSNASVASISKNKTTTKGEEITITAGSSEGSAVITAKTEDGKFTKTCTVSVHDISGTTVMIYMCGADLESGSDRPGYLNSGKAGLASMDLDEILQVNGQPDDVNIVIQTGGANGWAKSEIKKDKSQRWEVRNKQLKKVSETTKKNMGLQSTLQDFVTWGLQNYPAEKYGLIMWNHGGAMGGCCFDEQNGNDGILADELYNAVKNARSTVGMSAKLDWITYDACLMAVQDVAEYNSYNFNYMLCSEESEAGYGYDYDAWLPTLYNKSNVSGAELLPVIGHTFMVEEKSLFQSWGDPFDQTQSVLDLSKISAYKTAIENLASSLYSATHGKNTKLSALNTALQNAKQYGYDSDYGYTFGIYDVKSAMTKINANTNFSTLSSQINAVNSALNDLVIFEEYGEATTGCGLCLYVPTPNFDVPYDYTGEYTGAHSNLTNWKKVANDLFWYNYGD